MKLIKQKDHLKVHDFDCIAKKKKQKSRHGPLMPSTVRCIICGPSNCGKTNVTLNMLLDPNGLRFKNVYVFSKSLNQPKYRLLAHIMRGVKEVGYYTYSDNEEVPQPNNVRPNSVMLFDDVACERQNHIRDYFAMGRHNNIDSIYMCQTYSRIPKQLVRDNANFIIIFKQDDMNLRHIYNDHVNTDMTFNQFKEICAQAWNEGKYGFLVIDKDRELNNGRYRLKFDTFVQV